MSRLVKSRRKRRPLVETAWIEWADVAKLFNLVPGDWAPPARAKVSAGQFHKTVSARFKAPDGSVQTARLRIERVDGQLAVTQSEVCVSYRLRPGLKAAS